MRQCFFNFRKGDELSVDRMGMYLPNLDAARSEALYAWRELVHIAVTTGEVPDDCSIEIRDADRQTVLTIPLGAQRRLH